MTEKHKPKKQKTEGKDPRNLEKKNNKSSPILSKETTSIAWGKAPANCKNRRADDREGKSSKLSTKKPKKREPTESVLCTGGDKRERTSHPTETRST